MSPIWVPVALVLAWLAFVVVVHRLDKRVLLVTLLAMAALAVVPGAQASTNCNATGNWCQGWAQVSTQTGGLASAERCFSWRITNTAPACPTTTSNEATWQMDAGGCLTLYWFDTSTGVSPPAVPNKVTIQYHLDVVTASAMQTVQSAAAEPANGASASFCATTDGIAGSAARAGTYRIRIQVVKDNGPGGVGNYDISSDGVANVGAITHYDQGALRSLQKVSSITRSAYPAGSTFAYGTAGNEQITVTATYTQPNEATGAETSRTSVVSNANVAVGVSGAAASVGGTTSLAQSHTVDPTNTPSSGSPYVAAYVPTGNSALTGLTWTLIANSGNGANIVRAGSGAYAYDSTTFNIDPRIVLDSTGTHSFAAADDTAIVHLTNCSGAVVTVLNRGEAACSEFFLLNARGEKLSRAMTAEAVDSVPNVCISLGSLTPTANKYTATYTVPTGGSCAAAATTSGTARFLRITNTGQTHTSLQTRAVSSLYFVDPHTQLSATLNKDNFPTQDANEDSAYIISNAQTDTTHGWCHVVSVRKDVDIDTSGSAVTWTYIDPVATTRLTGTTDTGSDGWTSTHLDLLASTPLGSWKFRCDVAFNGNTATTDQTFTVSVPAGTSNAAGDPLRITCSPGLAYAGDSVLCAISESNSDGSGRTGNAAGTLIDLYNPSNTQIVTGGATTEVANGIYRYTVTVSGSPALGSYLAVVRTTDASPVASSTAFTVRATPTVYATPSDVTAAQTAINAHTDGAVTSINSHTDTTVNAARDLIRTDVAAVKTDTAAILAKWGTTDAATIRSDISTLQGRIGASTDASSTATVFGKIALAHEHSDANDATTQASIATLQATATATSSLLTDLHTEVGAHGKSRTAFHVLEDIEAALASAGLTQSTAFDNLTADVYEMHQDVHEIQNATNWDTQTMKLDLLHPAGTITDPGLGWYTELVFWIAVFWYIARNRNLFMLVFALGGVLHLFNASWFFSLDKSLPWLMLGALLDLFLKNRKASKKPQGE
jgi:hypothetical protein